MNQNMERAQMREGSEPLAAWSTSASVKGRASPPAAVLGEARGVSQRSHLSSSSFCYLFKERPAAPRRRTI